MRGRLHAAVLGDGGWGTALAIHLDRLGHQVTWWGVFPEYLRELDRRRVNRKFLPGVRIPRRVRIEPRLALAVADADLVILAIPAQFMRSVARRLARARALSRRAILVSAAKGLERRTLRRMSQVVREEVGRVRLVAISGPSIAGEVARGRPASVVAASGDPRAARQVQRWMMNERLRIYTSRDVLGVELGGALKNPIAIAAGIGDGLGLGHNAKAAIVTRGVAEMARLGAALGARESTFWGLSGLGDLVTTCLSGRNRWLGEQIGRGRSPRAALSETPMVIEGVETSRVALALARRHRVDVPLIERVVAVLFRGQPAAAAFRMLMRRSGKAERS